MNKSSLQNIRNIFLVILGFIFPLSVAISNILLLSIVFLVLIERDFKNKIKKVFFSKWMISIIVFSSLYFLSFAIFGDSNSELKRDHISRILQISSLLLILPVLYSIKFSQRAIKISVFLFLISMFISSLIAILANYEIIYTWDKMTQFKYGFYLKYTDHNVFLAASIVLAVLVFFRAKLSSYIKVSILLFILIYLFSLFSERGVAGWVVFIILLAGLFIYLYKHNFRVIFLFIVGILFISSFLYNNLDNIKNTINYKVENLFTSERHLLLKNTIQLIKKQPIQGYGAGSWRYEFNKINTQAIVSKEHKTPHNNYLYVWMELGVFGFILLLLIFYFQIIEMYKKDIVLILLPIMFLILMFADSYFLSQNTLVLYIFLSVVAVNYQGKLS